MVKKMTNDERLAKDIRNAVNRLGKAIEVANNAGLFIDIKGEFKLEYADDGAHCQTIWVVISRVY